MIKRDINLIQRYNKPFAQQKQFSKKAIGLISGFLVAIILVMGVWSYFFIFEKNSLNADINAAKKAKEDSIARQIATIGTLGNAAIKDYTTLMAAIGDLTAYSGDISAAKKVIESRVPLMGDVIIDLGAKGMINGVPVIRPQSLNITNFVIDVEVELDCTNWQDANVKLQNYVKALQAVRYNVGTDKAPVNYRLYGTIVPELISVSGGKAVASLMFVYIPVLTVEEAA